MKFTFPPKLIGVVSAAAISLILIIKVNESITNKVDHQITEIQNRYVPMLELGPQFENQFETIRRDFQDAVSSHDSEILESTLKSKKNFLDLIAEANKVLEPSQIKALNEAFESYFTSAYDVSSRLMAGETGVTLVRVMVHMQLKQARFVELMKEATTFDRNKLNRALSDVTKTLEKAVRTQLIINVLCVIAILLFSFWLSQPDKSKFR